jgi:hypothetical protein
MRLNMPVYENIGYDERCMNESRVDPRRVNNWFKIVEMRNK